MARRIQTDEGRMIPANPQQDEVVLAGRKDSPSIAYYLINHRGRHYFYAYRPTQEAYGAHLHEVCSYATRDEVREAVHTTATFDALEAYADIARLRELGLVPEALVPQEKHDSE